MLATNGSERQGIRSWAESWFPVKWQDSILNEEVLGWMKVPSRVTQGLVLKQILTHLAPSVAMTDFANKRSRGSI